MKKILLTGFGPFGRFKRNPSWQAARLLDGKVVCGFEVASRMLPTSYARAPRLFLKALKEVRPAAVVCTGVYTGKLIRLEKVALNVLHSKTRDADGKKKFDKRILAGKPLAVETRLPLSKLLKKLGRRAYLSHSAGTYLCNQIFYYCVTATRKIPAGFIHVPSKMKIRKISRAIETCIECVAHEIKNGAHR